MKALLAQSLLISRTKLNIPRITSNLLRLKPEGILAHRVALFLQREFPSEIYRFDVAADLSLPANIAKRVFSRIKATYNHEKGYPDLFIASPRRIDGIDYCGYYIELKATKDDLMTKSGHIRKSAHFTEQATMLAQLGRIGYKAEFAWGDNDDVFHKIHDYLNAAPAQLGTNGYTRSEVLTIKGHGDAWAEIRIRNGGICLTDSYTETKVRGGAATVDIPLNTAPKWDKLLQTLKTLKLM